MSDLRDPVPWADDAEDNRRWIESGGTEGSAAQWIGEDLSGRDLRRAVLAEATLIDSDFTGAFLDGADLSRTTGGGARFYQARMSGATLVKASLSGASFEGAHAPGARFDKADLTGADLAGANLRGASLDQAALRDASLAGADLREASLWKTVLASADLSRADLRGARIADAQVDAATRLDGAIGILEANVESVLVHGRRLAAEDARSWLLAQAARPAWSAIDLELWLLSKMSSPRVPDALAALGKRDDDMRAVAAALAEVFERPGHEAGEYRRVLGAPRATSLSGATGSFAGSFRHAYVLPLWPDVELIVHEHPTGYAWGVGFQGGLAALPDDLATIDPWRWTAATLRAAAQATEIVEEWSYDLEAILTFAGGRRFRARFDLELLQSWEPA
jgi:uncharacterized protein YjbI with pentapeptide repeats